MQTTQFLKAGLASAVSAAILLCGTMPVAARDRDTGRAKASAALRAAERTSAAPRAVERTHTAPRVIERTYTPPHAVERTYVQPRTIERAPRLIERAPVRTAPRERFIRVAPAPRERFVHVAPAPRERFVRVAPAPGERFVHVAPAPRERFVRIAPAPRERFVRVSPRAHIVRTAPFRERIGEPRRVKIRENRAPFREIVRFAPRHVTRFTTVRQVVTSPLMRAVFVPRRRVRVVYHPAYLTGRVVEIRRHVVVLQPAFGSQILVNAAALPRPAAYLPMNSYVTVPVTYANGMYSMYTPPGYAYNGYNYNPYGYPSDASAYCGSGSSVLYAALLPTVLSAVSGNGNVNANDLAALALTAVASGSNSCYQGYGAYPGYNAYPVYNAYPSGYATYAPVYGTTYPQYGSYATPYDNCAFGDNDEDDSYCATQYNGYGSYGYNTYGSNAYGYGLGAPGLSAYGLQQVQGMVVAKTGSMLMVLGGNGLSPIFVNAAPAFQNGYSVNGPVAVGQVIDAYGFYNGDTFVATSIV